MTPDPTRSVARYFLRFLDYFCALFAILYFNTPQLPNVPVLVLAAVVVAFIFAWVAWRLRPRLLTALALAATCLATMLAGNSGLTVLPLWLGFVALSQTLGERSARVFGAVAVFGAAAVHLFNRTHPYLAAVDIVSMVVVAISGIALSRTVSAAFRAEEDSRELARSKERERIAAGLHDGLGHLLTAIGMSLDFASRVLTTDPRRAHAELAQARATTSEALETMRTTVRTLAPLPLIDDNLAATLETLASRFNGTTLNVQLVGTMRGRLTDEVAQLAVAFAQESLTNVVRHARATDVRISLNDGELSVADNGAGNTRTPGFGLSSLAERAHSLGARLDTEPHGGINGGFRATLVFEGKDTQ